MINLDNILTSNFHFGNDETLLKYRFKFINTMLIVGILITFSASIIRLYLSETVPAMVDAILCTSFVFGLFYLRKEKKYFNIVSTFILGISFLAFTAITIVMHDDHTKFLWYALLLTVAFMIKGEKAGLITYITTISTLSFLYFTPFVNLYIKPSEFAMAIFFYTTMMIYNLIAVKQQHKNLDSLKNANQEIKKQQVLLSDQLHTHPLTKLPNTLALEETIALCDDDIALLSLCIDDYLTIENTYGQEFSQVLISQCANILSQFTNQEATLYHIHGANFAFLIKKLKNDRDIHLAQSIKSLFENTFITINELEISISFSTGISRHKSDKLIIQANTILQEIMQNSMNHYKLYTPNKQREEMQKNNLYWNAIIKSVIVNDKLAVYYQPIICNKTQSIQKYECLVRAIDKDKVIAPFMFLNAAKSRGLLPSITKTVIEKSFKLFSQNDIDFSINITEDDLKDDYLIPFLKHKLEKYNIQPQRVYLEVLENITSIDADNVLKQFQELKQLGFKISIDDFGAEASNLSRLLTIKADIIKIDGQFIKNLDNDQNSIKIVETIVSLAQKLGCKTVAEFVHNEEIFHIVNDLGVDYSQGYYFSPPLPNVAKESTLVTS